MCMECSCAACDATDSGPDTGGRVIPFLPSASPLDRWWLRLCINTLFVLVQAYIRFLLSRLSFNFSLNIAFDGSELLLSFNVFLGDLLTMDESTAAAALSPSTSLPGDSSLARCRFALFNNNLANIRSAKIASSFSNLD